MSGEAKMQVARTLRLSPKFSLPPEAVTETFAIIAKRGVGKTYTAAVMTEEFIKAGLPVVVIDPIGVWWGLRASADGKHEGLPIVVLGGDHGDAPLEVHAGEVIASMVAQDRLSLVIDFSLFRKGEHVRFMTDFCETLYRKNRQALHLVMDEADAFAPQRPMPGEQRLLGSVEDLVRRGRARGIGITLVTQRAAVLNKNVLTQVEVLVTLRTIAPQDRAAVDEWIKVHGTPEQRSALMESLASLPIGTAWFWSPGWLDVFQRVEIRKRETFDSSSTPKAQEGVKVQPKLAAVDLQAIQARIADTIARAKAEDPRELRRRIQELEGELKKQKPAGIDPAALMEAEKRGLERGLREGQKESDLIAGNWQAAKANLEQAISRMDNSFVSVIGLRNARVDSSTVPVQRGDGRFDSGLTAPAHKPSLADRVVTVAQADSAGVGAAHRKLLIALAQHGGMDTDRLAALSGHQLNGTFYNKLGALRTAGYVTAAKVQPIEITPEGREFLGPYDPLPVGKELRQWWLNRVGSARAKMLEVLFEKWPQPLSSDELASLSGHQRNGTYYNKLGALRTLGIVAPAGQPIKAMDFLF
jgi:hypothetical protein